MPSPPAFDYYEALEVDKSATLQDITSSYRRLALVHHPDKNPDNPDATSNFQKIALAYETLKNERSRAIYDARSAPRSAPRPGHSPFDSDDDSYYDYEDDGEVDDELYEDFMRFFGERRRRGAPTFVFTGGGFAFSFGGFDGGPREPDIDYEEMRKMRREQEEAEEAWRRQFVDEVQRRKDEEQAKAKARTMAKEAEEKAKALAKERREKEERAKQEQIWVDENATTQEEKQDSCLHSEFWAKEKHQKKIKCTSCGQKRGMVGHRCPHCSLLVCQVCLNELRNAP